MNYRDWAGVDTSDKPSSSDLIIASLMMIMFCAGSLGLYVLVTA